MDEEDDAVVEDGTPELATLPEAPEIDEEEAQKREAKRLRIIQEIEKTETDYVNDLTMLVEHYLKPMQKLSGELFDDSTIATVFGNGALEKIQATHVSLLDCLVEGGPDDTSNAFLRHIEDFKVYGFYVSNHPKASTTLEDLKAKDFQIKKFFEGCTLMAGKSMDGLMLKPIQRICQYPMLLGELKKKTDPSHATYKQIEEALEVAKSMALSINEDKRNKEELIAIHKKFLGWRGPPISATSTQLIHDGVLTKISGKKVQERHFFLFDNLLVYCKRTLKGLHVQGKLLINDLNIKSLIDGEEVHGGQSVNHVSTT